MSQVWYSGRGQRPRASHNQRRRWYHLDQVSTTSAQSPKHILRLKGLAPRFSSLELPGPTWTQPDPEQPWATVPRQNKASSKTKVGHRLLKIPCIMPKVLIGSLDLWTLQAKIEIYSMMTTMRMMPQVLDHTIILAPFRVLNKQKYLRDFNFSDQQ